MTVEAVMVSGPSIDFSTLLTLTHHALGYNIAEMADSCPRRLSDSEKFMMCLAGIKDQNSDITDNLLSHVSYSIMLVADKREFIDMLELTSGMSFIRADTTLSQVDISVISGTLLQWRDAIVTGTSQNATPQLRNCFSKILLLFDRVGLSGIWSGYSRTTATDRSGFLLEYNG